MNNRIIKNCAIQTTKHNREKNEDAAIKIHTVLLTLKPSIRRENKIFKTRVTENHQDLGLYDVI